MRLFRKKIAGRKKKPKKTYKRDVSHKIHVSNHCVMDIKHEGGSLVFIKDAKSFYNIKIVESRIKCCKSIPAFYKFKNLKKLKISDLKFMSKNVEGCFFRSCEELDNLSDFCYGERNYEMNFGFSGYMECRKLQNPTKNNGFLWGLFSTKKVCLYTYWVQDKRDKKLATFLLQQFRYMQIQAFSFCLGYANNDWMYLNCRNYLNTL